MFTKKEVLIDYEDEDFYFNFKLVDSILLLDQNLVKLDFNEGKIKVVFYFNVDQVGF